MTTWLFDITTDPNQIRLNLWFHDGKKVFRRSVFYHPTIYISGRPDRLHDLEMYLSRQDWVQSFQRDFRRTELEHPKPIEVLSVKLKRHHDLHMVGKQIEKLGRVSEFRVYNLDPPVEVRYSPEHGLFPMPAPGRFLKG